jgi:hypothetical protein
LCITNKDLEIGIKEMTIKIMSILTTKQLLRGEKIANRNMQNRVLKLKGEIRELKKENAELKEIIINKLKKGGTLFV